MPLRSKRSLAAGTWLVTGAASGLGREFVRQLHARGERVALWDSDVNGMDATCAMAACPSAHREVVDVRDAEAVHEAAARTRSTVGRIAHVIHCAGVARGGSFSSVSAADYRDMIETNALGSVHVALASLPLLKQSASAEARSTLMFVSSVAGLRAMPQLAGFSASKYAVTGLAQSLRDELADEPIDIKLLCPPLADTPLLRKLPESLPSFKLARVEAPSTVVTAALEAFDRRDWVTIVGTRSRALWRTARVAPAIVDRVMQWARR
jgi:NAD(P)-dependent dehydrogenase (short-subunit alcohol dehydrogenase family)